MAFIKNLDLGFVRFSTETSSLSPRYSGFTLAEVLITLGVIGVVAAMTIPTLVSNYEKHVLVTQTKKAYAVASEAVNKLAADTNCVGDLSCTGLFDTNTLDFGNDFVKYFKVLKNCQLDRGCLTNSFSYYYDGSGGRWDDEDQEENCYKFITTDGMAWDFYDNSGDCTTNSPPNKLCASFSVDVNGPTKGPNNWGRDMQFFDITKTGKIIPIGGLDWETTGACTPANMSGSDCSGRIMAEGWQMNY